MKIVLIHYHLKTGGVSTVIKQQLAAIQNECQVLVITGESPLEPLSADTITIEGLAYDTPRTPPVDPLAVAETIMQAIQAKFGDSCDVVHVHNPTLAKNKHLLTILTQLQKNGFKLLLQVHDFAEDGRPHVYYPDAYISDCHYAVINTRDHQHLQFAGLSPTGLHLLPNTVTFPQNASQPARSSKQILYPVRAIRRKNIGEAILVSLFFKNGEHLAITLPPNSPADFVSYHGWRQLVEDLALSVVFEVGMQSDFNKLLRSAKFILTTSIAEGFGFSFLEPWLAGNTLWGRRLTDICQDFEGHGIRLDHLYNRLNIPLKWIDRPALYQRWQACIQDTARIYRFRINPHQIDQAFETITATNTIDFAILDESFQKQIIQRIAADPSATDQMCRLNPFLKYPGKIPNRDSICRQNRQAVLTHYSQAKLKQRLLNVYAQVVSTPVTHRIDKPTLLRLFLNLNNFSLLKWCHYVESADV